MGTIRLQARAEFEGTVVRLDGVPRTTTGVTGAFALLGEAPRTYSITARRPLHLDMATMIEIRVGEVVNMGDALMVAGDTDGDGRIGLDDYLRIVSGFGNCVSDPGFDPAADLDESGCIDAIDLELVTSNYGRVGPTLWVPVP